METDPDNNSSPDKNSKNFESPENPEWRRRCQIWGNLTTKIGKRYDGCRFDNFETNSEEQRDVVRILQDFSESIVENVNAGRNVILFGPVGCGKDHLATALMQSAVRYGGFETDWTNGADLFGRVRDSMDSGELESSVVREFTAPDVLCISDPVPPWGELTQFQAGFFLRVIDIRYRRLQPTWITINVAGGSEANQRLGAQVSDRLRHNALSLACNWESFRKGKN